jgi:(+)-trans-carveol dehydrogenase
MAGRVEGKVAFITGAARGQGRSHAVRLAEEGADIIATDICAQIDTVSYPLASEEDLAETVRLVEKLGRRVVARPADVRDLAALRRAADEGVAELGRLDIVVANAGIASYGPAAQLDEQTWQDMIDTNLTGAWHTYKATIGHMVRGGSGGSVILISSTCGLKGLPGIAHYVSAKHGMVGLMRSLAHEVAPHMIRVNTLHPTNVHTDMVDNDASRAAFRPDLEHPTMDDLAVPALLMHLLPVPWLDPREISHAVLFLASDEARFITGAVIPVDAGMTQK